MKKLLVSAAVPAIAVFAATMGFAALHYSGVLRTDTSRTTSTDPEFRVEPSPQRLARGRYLVEGPAHCFHCHSERDFKETDGELHADIRPGRKGAGLAIEVPAHGDTPSAMYVLPNITPDKETGIGNFTDAQLERAIRQGIGHDGKPLWELMPYAFFRSMTDEDVASVIVYLRSIPPVKNALPKSRLPFEPALNLHPELVMAPAADASEQVRKGWYLVRIGQCASCHTASDEQGNTVTSLIFGGGERLKGDWGDVVSPNITSDPSGIAHYDTAMFIKTIRTGYASGGTRKLNPIMPYEWFKNLTDEDLAAIFAYLQSVKPVKHLVDNSEPPTYCRLCRHMHGLGDRN
jgi:mono/diheme cytochrome c family protein